MVPVFVGVIVLTAVGKERRGIRFGTAETSLVESGVGSLAASPTSGR
jgi:SHS family lactate transporter-like MFS transporter